MRLEHYTEKPFAFDRSRVYEQERPHVFGKPRGLWVSVAGEDDWPAWCRGEDFLVGSLKHRAVIELDKSANLYIVQSRDGLFELHDRYATVTKDWFPLECFPTDGKRYWSLDWGKMAVDYDGLIVAPYLWSCRTDGPQWYYGMDCASGCIWNLDAIAEVRSES